MNPDMDISSVVHTTANFLQQIEPSKHVQHNGKVYIAARNGFIAFATISSDTEHYNLMQSHDQPLRYATTLYGCC